jgi:hypothetical protein
MDDVEAWIIAQLEPPLTAPDEPGNVRMDGPGGLAIRAESDWFQDDDPVGPCRGVTVEVSIAGEPVGDFTYTVADGGVPKLMERLEPEQAARVAAAVGDDPWTPLAKRPPP